MTTDYTRLQAKLRLKILELHYKAGSGHIGASLSCIDAMIALVMHKAPGDDFILSKGHAASALYTILNETGNIPDEDITTFYKNATKLPAHPAALKYRAIPFATGSLGHGLPLAAGIAKANKLQGNGNMSYVLMSDGETNEGTTWEAAHFAVANRLDNLFVFIDKNGLQGFDNTKNVLGDTAAHDTWQAMGFDVIEADGHDIAALITARDWLTARNNGLPKLIIGNTAKGKGVSYMEHRLEWHYLPMTQAQYEDAVAGLKQDNL